MDVLGRDSAAESYRVAVDIDGRRIVAHVPERLLAAGPRPSHEMAYEGLAADRKAITRSIADLCKGTTPRPPYDQILLAEES